MLPMGFVAGGIHCGIAKKKTKKDLALFYSHFPCVCAAMFTRNNVKAAPVLVSQRHLKASTSVSAIVANSGCANACTGRKGIRDAETMCASVARLAGLSPQEVAVASTGVIGRPLPMHKVSKGITSLWNEIRSGNMRSESAVDAIMTTDTVRKISQRMIPVDNTVVTIWGCVKGSGMIHPDLAPHATMLSFILTDACIEKKALSRALESASDISFNCVTVDGDTSTNDSVFILANGQAKNHELKTGSADYVNFKGALTDICVDLAKMMAADGEGATHFITVEVRGARTDKDARAVASVIATSPLVKTAIFGKDANWGRIIAAAGRSGVRVNPDTIDISFSGLVVAKGGRDTGFSEGRARKILDEKELLIEANLHMGKGKATYYTCDYSIDYIKINANYRT